MFWIIAFFTSAVLLIMMLVVFILFKMKTHAFVELKAFFKKVPVSIFTDDGKFLDMRADKVDSGLVIDKNYGTFIRNEGNSYLGKSTRNVYDLYDIGFAPGINVKAAQTSQVLREVLDNDASFFELQKAIASGELKDERLDCVRANVNTASLKKVYT
jgi:hypothetical protein